MDVWLKWYIWRTFITKKENIIDASDLNEIIVDEMFIIYVNNEVKEEPYIGKIKSEYSSTSDTQQPFTSTVSLWKNKPLQFNNQFPEVLQILQHLYFSNIYLFLIFFLQIKADGAILSLTSNLWRFFHERFCFCCTVF